MQLEHPATLGGPFTRARNSIPRTMALVMLALTPATLFGLWQFGWPAIWLFVVTLATALVLEAVTLRIAGKPVQRYLFDGSALLTAWLLALSLPPWAPWWIGAVGALMAILLGKQVFGGLGQNPFNPAMVARVALLIAFPLEMTQFVAPTPLFSATAPGFLDGLGIAFGAQPIDALSGATLLGTVRTELGQGAELGSLLSAHFAPVAGLLGGVSGSLGETSALLLLLGGVFLIVKGVISWRIPVAMLGTIAVLALLMQVLAPGAHAGVFYHLLSGATLLGAFFIATDPVTSPVSPRGQLLFGAGCGALVYIIRAWGGYPEGVAFAVLLMNACTPLIDHYLRPRILGRDRRGRPLEPETTEVRS